MLTETQRRKPVAVRMLNGNGKLYGWRLYRRGGAFGTLVFYRYFFTSEQQEYRI